MMTAGSYVNYRPRQNVKKHVLEIKRRGYCIHLKVRYKLLRVHEKKNSAFELYTALIFNVAYIVHLKFSEHTHNWEGYCIECVQLELNSNDFSILLYSKNKDIVVLLLLIYLSISKTVNRTNFNKTKSHNLYSNYYISIEYNIINWY